MTATDYTIDPDNRVYKRGKLVAHGPLWKKRDALHAVWTIEGKPKNAFFVEKDGKVYETEIEK